MLLQNKFDKNKFNKNKSIKSIEKQYGGIVNSCFNKGLLIHDERLFIDTLEHIRKTNKASEPIKDFVKAFAWTYVTNTVKDMDIGSVCFNVDTIHYLFDCALDNPSNSNLIDVLRETVREFRRYVVLFRISTGNKLISIEPFDREN